MRRQFSRVVLLCCLVAANAQATPPERLYVDDQGGACPSASDVGRELRAVFPQTRFETRPELGVETVAIDDGGERWVVSVAGESKSFHDPKRDCLERARNAAVFVALALDPLRLPSPEPEPRKPSAREPAPPTAPGQPPEPAPAPPSDDASKSDSRLDLELGPLLWVSPASSSTNTPRAGGASARLRYGGELALSLGVAALLPTSLQYEQAAIQARWVPVDLNLRFGRRFEPWELAVEGGVTAAWLELQGENVADSRRTSRLELGARLATSLRFWAGANNAVSASLHGAYFPRPYRLELAGLGEVGRTPELWVGAAIGAVIDLN